MNTKRKVKLVLGFTIATIGAGLTGAYEANTVTLSIIALGLSIFTVGIRSELLGVFTAVMGMNFIFIGYTYEEIGMIIKIVVSIVGLSGIVVGCYIQANEFMGKEPRDSGDKN